MLKSLQRISTKYYGSALSQEEETGVYGPGGGSQGLRVNLDQGTQSLGSNRTAFPQDAQPASTPGTVQPVGQASQQGRNAGPAAVQLLWEARWSDSTVVCRRAGISEPLPHQCCSRPRERPPELKACFSGMEASFAYDTASCCLADGESQQDHSLPTVPGKMEPEFKPFPSPLLLQVPFSCQFLTLASQREYCTHQ